MSTIHNWDIKASHASRNHKLIAQVPGVVKLLLSKKLELLHKLYGQCRGWTRNAVLYPLRGFVFNLLEP